MKNFKIGLASLLMVASVGAFAQELTPAEKTQKIGQFCGMYGNLGAKALEAKNQGLTFEQTSQIVSIGIEARAMQDTKAHPERKEEYQELKGFVLQIARSALADTFQTDETDPEAWGQTLNSKCLQRLNK